MIRRPLLIPALPTPALLTAALISASLAVLSVPAAAGDNRLVSRAYKSDEIVRIDGKLNVQASVMFAEGESIENVAVGDSESWQITPNKRANLLFVKPLSATARTNMTVVTDKRTYFFDLVASTTATPVYALRFTYPTEAKPQLALPGAAPLPGIPLATPEQQALSGEAPVDPAMLNFSWAKAGAPKLHPSRIYDDGQSTYVTWAAGVPIPAILIRNEKNEEGPVNFAVRGDSIVIDGVPGQIVLRSGKAIATLSYRGNRSAASAQPQSAQTQSAARQPVPAQSSAQQASLNALLPPGAYLTNLTALPSPGAPAAAVAAAPAPSKPQSE